MAFLVRISPELKVQGKVVSGVSDASALHEAATYTLSEVSSALRSGFSLGLCRLFIRPTVKVVPLQVPAGAPLRSAQGHPAGGAAAAPSRAPQQSPGQRRGGGPRRWALRAAPAGGVWPRAASG